MKKTLYTYLTLLLALSTMTGCNKWLDVPIDGQASDKELFATGDGYRSALNGLYKGMATPTLYGKELQFGIIDFFSNQYRTDLPQNELSSRVYLAAGDRKFKDKDLQPKLDQIWLSSYKIIAAANDLIAHVSSETDLKKFKNQEMERDMILGEAMAVRAFMHFDMLRLYAPAPINDDGRPYIPYVEDYPNTHASHLSSREVLKHVITDLEAARKLVKPFDDTALGQAGIAYGRTRLYGTIEYGWEGSNKEAKLDIFLQGRGFRFSYWAITAMLARVYQYNAAFDPSYTDKAMAAANEVLDLELKSLLGNPTSPFKDEDFGGFMWSDNPEYMNDLRMPSTFIFGVANENELIDAGLERTFVKTRGGGQSNHDLFVVDVRGQKIFENSAGKDEQETDIRATRLLYNLEGSQTLLSTKWYLKDDTKDRDRTITVLPLLRTSELRFILAEGYARKGQFEDAYRILNEMRKRRQVEDDLVTRDSWSEFVKDLVNEGQREWISEGQLFYLYKRLNAPVHISSTEYRPFKQEECVLPIPNNESI